MLKSAVHVQLPKARTGWSVNVISVSPGVLLKSDLYLTLGISGQIQHMVGGNGAKVIVAINKDKNAPIFNYADYGLVGDIYKVVPALISQLSR
ncbi:putative electron transfer flavoprotein subunit alpha [Escherichia coli]|uniref:Putative electron transfer flavoprotein subunit alpha n=1 Tax=Escherichia coli TaxID=562 RepID=A0A376W454_ECOLX|nr:putative electron transfer flavoprotein subunit alpha [Escherichia coli]